MSYTNRKFNWDFDSLKRFYNNYVIKWINSAMAWTDAQVARARANVGGTVDVSVLNAVQGTPATYESLTAALEAVPQVYKRGGMSVKFIQGNAPSSDNKYVQYRYMSSSTAAADFTNVANWYNEYVGISDNISIGGFNISVNDTVKNISKQEDTLEIQVDLYGSVKTYTDTPASSQIKFANTPIPFGNGEYFWAKTKGCSGTLLNGKDAQQQLGGVGPNEWVRINRGTLQTVMLYVDTAWASEEIILYLTAINPTTIINGMKNDVSELQGTTSGLQEDVEELQGDVSALKETTQDLDLTVNGGIDIKTETTTINSYSNLVVYANVIQQGSIIRAELPVEATFTYLFGVLSNEQTEQIASFGGVTSVEITASKDYQGLEVKTGSTTVYGKAITVTISKNQEGLTDKVEDLQEDVEELQGKVGMGQTTLVLPQSMRYLGDGERVSMYWDNFLYKPYNIYDKITLNTDLLIKDSIHRIMFKNMSENTYRNMTFGLAFCNTAELLTKQMTVYADADDYTSNPPIKALIIGDSMTAQQFFPDYLGELCDEHNLDVEFLGTVLNEKREVDPNVWGWKSYGQGVTPNEGRGGWNAKIYATMQTYGGKSNPFYNPQTQGFDFSYYMSSQSYTGCDLVIIALGANDTIYGDYDWDAFKNYYDAMISSIKQYNANAKIIIWLEPLRSLMDGNGRKELDSRLVNVINKIAYYDNRENENLYLTPVYLCVDNQNDYQYLPYTINDGMESWRVCVDDIHPSHFGYKHIAKMVFGYLRYVTRT